MQSGTKSADGDCLAIGVARGKLPRGQSGDSVDRVFVAIGAAGQKVRRSNVSGTATPVVQWRGDGWYLTRGTAVSIDVALRSPQCRSGERGSSGLRCQPQTS